MKIGELADATATPVETIRYYERVGLLPPPARTAGNYRAYGAEHRERLAFVRRCRALDMSLDEVRALLAFCDAPQADCGEVNALLDEHIEHVALRIRELQALAKQLKQLRAQCAAVSSADQCGILKALSIDPPGGGPAAEFKAHGVHQGGVHKPVR